ncbi:TetR family transcriptional regulator [Bacteriovorax stolpii]|uniref:TetR family transcriptional regulator n=1 Tax=Bacteriovorax stolpii TaxID=960 RepID=A0A2K9NRG6_BACTC|nr:TetR/AcrR family transcriptional regulator [Bacteriovorax stolpii]AUN97344.1 TetR family transcriptional regulator [Bacteriovorax stolpii]TDP52515.1 TetR family transcriptional regulator [Bacteriovorax stolpii]
MGLRQLKKQKTRKAISDLATKLFLERGYYNVTTAEIAELAEVSIPTLFKYFPTKEMLVFDEDFEIEEWLVDSVKNRKKGQGILDALLKAWIERISEVPASHRKNAKAFMALIEETPELSRYAGQMWMRHEKVLAEVIKKETKGKFSKVQTEVVARFVLDGFYRAMKETKPKEVLKEIFQLLKIGWNE